MEDTGTSTYAFVSQSDASGLDSSTRKRILCADDHEDTRTMIAYWLNQRGYEVTTTSSVAETLPLAEKGGFDLLILDGRYSDGLGVNLCKQIRSLDGKTPIIFLSACCYNSDIKTALESGAQVYVTKPFDFDMFEQTVEKLIL